MNPSLSFETKSGFTIKTDDAMFVETFGTKKTGSIGHANIILTHQDVEDNELILWTWDIFMGIARGKLIVYADNNSRYGGRVLLAADNNAKKSGETLVGVYNSKLDSTSPTLYIDLNDADIDKLGVFFNHNEYDILGADIVEEAKLKTPSSSPVITKANLEGVK